MDTGFVIGWGLEPGAAGSMVCGIPKTRVEAPILILVGPRRSSLSRANLVVELAQEAEPEQVVDLEPLAGC